MGTAIVDIWWGFCSVEFSAMSGPAGMFSYFDRLNVQHIKPRKLKSLIRYVLWKSGYKNMWQYVEDSGLLVCGSVILGYLSFEDKNAALLKNIWNCSTIQHHIPEGLNSQHSCCENLKFI